MQFLVGLSIGLHLGKVIRKYLESAFYDLGLLTDKQVAKIEQINNIEDDISSILDEISSIKDIKTTSRTMIYYPSKHVEHYRPVSFNRR